MGTMTSSDGNTTHDVTKECSVQVSITNGAVTVHPPNTGGHLADGTTLSAELAWDPADVTVRLDGQAVTGSTCRVGPHVSVFIEPVLREPDIRYDVQLSRDRMEATLRVERVAGYRSIIDDAMPAASVRIATRRETIEPELARVSDAIAALHRAGVVEGVDEQVVAQTCDTDGASNVVAVGVEPVEGRDGFLEPLLDFRAARRAGVLASTPLVRRVRSRRGTNGRDVTGRELTVPAVRDVRLKAGNGVDIDEQGILAIASVDGAPVLNDDGLVEVRHELVLEVVDAACGDVNFNGSVKIEGDVGEGRVVIARDELHVEGNVDRARLESGGAMQIDGSIMSSVLRAGGERAVAATIADRVLDLPAELASVAAQAREIRDAAAARGQQIPHGLSVQLVLERLHGDVVGKLESIRDDLLAAGLSHAVLADKATRWARTLRAAANVALSVEQFQEIHVEVGALADDVRRAVEQRADLHVNYMQASEAEATGEVTLVGKGIFNSRIVAWGGMQARGAEAVVRGGSLVSHGMIEVTEIGSPAGARTDVQLARGAELRANRAYAGTIIHAPGYTHRFVADRASVHVHFDAGGGMDVDSLAV